MIVGIIGGGVSGMAASLRAAENPAWRVILVERQARVGRKLQATGNGRCNLTNLHAAQGGYHGDDAAFSRYALEQFSPERTLAWFRELGLVFAAAASGCSYPFSDPGNSGEGEVQKVRREATGFTLETGGESLHCDKLIIACGGLAGTKLGGSMSGYKLLRSMGHGCTRLRPTLVQLKTDWPGVSALKGVRAECRAEISRDGEPWSESSGEIQFTEYGLSGPVIFEISRDVCQRKGNWFCCLDLLPQLTEQALAEMLLARRKTGLNAGELFTGILHNRLGRVLVQETGIGLNTPIAQLPEKALLQAAANAKCFRVHLTEPLGMDSAQVTAGGIVTAEFDEKTMESKLVPGLYACGEVLDVDGDCGGYNLQWAWSSGSLAGMHAGEAELC